MGNSIRGNGIEDKESARDKSFLLRLRSLEAIVIVIRKLFYQVIHLLTDKLGQDERETLHVSGNKEWKKCKKLNEIWRLTFMLTALVSNRVLVIIEYGLLEIQGDEH